MNTRLVIPRHKILSGAVFGGSESHPHEVHSLGRDLPTSDEVLLEIIFSAVRMSPAKDPLWRGETVIGKTLNTPLRTLKLRTGSNDELHSEVKSTQPDVEQRVLRPS